MRDSSIAVDSRLLCRCPAQQVSISVLPGGITANNLRNGKAVALAALKGMPLAFFADGFHFFFEFELGGHQPQSTVNCTAAL